MSHVSLGGAVKQLDPQATFSLQQVRDVFGATLIDMCGPVSDKGFTEPIAHQWEDLVLLPDPGISITVMADLFPEMFNDEDRHRYRAERFFTQPERPTWRLLPRVAGFRADHEGVSARSVVLASLLFWRIKQEVLFRVPAVHTASHDEGCYVIDVAFRGSVFTIDDHLEGYELIMAPRPIF